MRDFIHSDTETLGHCEEIGGAGKGFDDFWH